MRISTRDLDVLAFVARFGQVRKDHVRSALFSDNASATPCDRSIKRLVDQGLLALVALPHMGGGKGGRGPNIYQIGSAGWKLANAEGSFWLSRSVKYHSLAIADVYVGIRQYLDVITFDTEPDSHVRVNYVLLNPDLFVELALNGATRRIWFEIDLGTERPKQLRDKMSGYYHAWSGAGDAWNPFPWVWFVVPDARRKREIEALISQQPKDAQAMFQVSTFETVVTDAASERVNTRN